MKSKTLKEIRLEHDLLQSDVARECRIDPLILDKNSLIFSIS